MPSPRKQQKQKRRASTKAKEKRIARNSGGERRDPFAAVPSDDPLNEQGNITPDTLLSAMEDSGELVELFETLAAEHAKGQQALCEAFLTIPPMLRLVQIWEEQDLTDFIFGFLISYKQWRDNVDDEQAVEWLESEAFQRDYVAASEAIAARA
ncbi:hypothetical protein [Pseudomonas sp. NPDC007930]|uniref:hypothetical protein n=1 Tax=Pseudomonas sp. NPDC007930 TaxID=3364417 RepID=UPI0036E9B493